MAGLFLRKYTWYNFRVVVMQMAASPYPLLSHAVGDFFYAVSCKPVQLGLHVQLGVSLSRNIKTALLQSWACKRKSIFCQSLCSLNCVAWLYINFSNPAFWFLFTLFKSPKTSKPRGRKFTASDGSWAHEFGETHKCAFWKARGVSELANSRHS